MNQNMDKQQEQMSDQQEEEKEDEKEEEVEEKEPPQQPENEEIIQPQIEQSISMKPRNSIYFSEFDWKLKDFSHEQILQSIKMIANHPVSFDNQGQEKQISISVVDAASKVSGFTKYTAFIIRGQDPTRGKIQIVRKSVDFIALREALTKRWPGCIIPPFPSKLSVGVTEGQILKNRVRFLNNFLDTISRNEGLYFGQQMQIFLKGEEGSVKKELQKLKPFKSEYLLKMYSEKFPTMFGEKSENFLLESEKTIKGFETYFLQKKTDLNYLKDQLKRTALMKDKMIKEKFRVFNKLLPAYEDICLDWFSQAKPKQEEKKQNEEQEMKEDQPIKHHKGEINAYGSDKFKGELQNCYDLFFGDEKNNLWIIFQVLKFQLKEIDTALEAINEYKLLNNDRKYFFRNVENNKKQIQDINSNKTSLKIFFLSGSTDEKKTQLSNETQRLENELKIRDELWGGITDLMVDQLKDFQSRRAKYYKYNVRQSFRRQAVNMQKIFPLYTNEQRS